MNNYELLLIISAKKDDDVKESIIKKIEAAVKADKGTVSEIDRWGVKELAYPIKYQKDGYYVLFNLTMNGSVIEMLEKMFNLDENVLRSLFIKKEVKKQTAKKEKKK